MILTFTITIEDGAPVADVAAYLAEQSDNLVGQLQTGVIGLPALDESIFIDYGQTEGREASFFRSE